MEADMKRIITMITTAALGLVMTLAAQQGAPVAAQQAPARAPHAWGDKDHDGKCDITGRPVGQRMGGRTAMRGGRGRRGGMALGMGRGNGPQGAGAGCLRRQAAVKPQAAPAPEKQ
jgi:hypothetical protein